MSLAKSIAVGAAALLALPCLADPPSLDTRNDARALTAVVMQLIAADKIGDAMDRLKPFWRIPATEIDTTAQKTISLRNAVADRYGSAHGYGFVREEDIDDFLVRYTYIEKRDNHPLRWVFIFYRPADKWWVDSVSWDDKVPELFERGFRQDR